MKKYVKVYEGHIVPEGATHYQRDQSNFYEAFIKKGIKSEVLGVFFLDDAGDKYGFSDEFKLREWISGKTIYSEVSSKAIPLPEAPQEWNGEGLPPVGTVCEFKSMGHHDGFEWCIFQGFMSDKSYIIEYHHHTSPSMTTCCPFDPKLTTFRPLKTQREKEREAFMSAARKATNADVDDVVATDIFDDMFHSGFTAPKEGEK